MRKIITLALSFIFLVLIVPAESLYIAGQEFAPEYVEGKIILENTGVALNRFKTHRVYAAGMFVHEKVDPRDTLDTDVAKRIELVFLQTIRKEELLEEFISRNIKLLYNKNYEQLELRIERMKAFFFDMEEGDRFAATYFPSKGTRLELNGTDLVMIDGGDFSFAFFSIFVGMKPMDVRGKTKLLGSLK